MKRFLLSSFLALVSYCMYAIDPNGARVDFDDSQGDSGSLAFMALVGMVLFPFVAFVYLSGKDKDFKWGCLSCWHSAFCICIVQKLYRLVIVNLKHYINKRKYEKVFENRATCFSSNVANWFKFV